MLKINLQQLLTVTQKILERINYELERTTKNKNDLVEEASEKVKNAIIQLKDSPQLEAEVEYYRTLEEIYQENDWDDYSGVEKMIQPSKN